MKIDGEVTRVETNGESLTVEIQGKGASDAGWRPLLPQIVRIADTPANAKAFYIGRAVSIVVTPK